MSMQFLLGWRRNLEDLLYQNSGLVLLHGAVFLVGVIFGALALRSLDGATRQELVRLLSESVQVLRQGRELSSAQLFQASLARQGTYLALFWVLAISMVGALGVVVITLLRGFVSGFAVALLAAEMGGRGVLLAAAGHLPHTLLEVPGILAAATASVAFGLEMIRSWRTRRRLADFYEALAGYTGTLLSAGVMLVMASLVEAFLTPSLTRFVTGWLP